MTVRYAALSACQKVHVCHCNSLGGATWRSVTITGRTDRRTDRVRRNMRPRAREEGRITNSDKQQIRQEWHSIERSYALHCMQYPPTPLISQKILGLVLNKHQVTNPPILTATLTLT